MPTAPMPPDDELARWEREGLVPAGAIPTRTKRAKYGNRKVTLPTGETFDSQREHARWLCLKMMERDGLVKDLRRQVRFPLVVNGFKVCVWVADFVYHDEASGRTEYEDCKGFRTKDYKLKSKLFRALMGQAIRET